MSAHRRKPNPGAEASRAAVEDEALDQKEKPRAIESAVKQMNGVRVRRRGEIALGDGGFMRRAPGAA